MKLSLVAFALPALFSLSIQAEETESPLRLIRTTEAQTPAQEEKALHVPEGFEVHLFASEPMINKPVNMAFDERGRLWVSSTKEYPYSADKSRWADPQGSHIKDSTDAIKILEDTDGDGVADKVTVFADGLNIPTGVLPWHRPEDKAGCIAWSIPNIWYFADTTGKGVCDKREVLFGPLGYEKDTHGMCSSFRLGLDGWVYATHGFNNTSHIKVLPQHFKPSGPEDKPDTLDLHSGNVFRFRPDGSHVEIWSWGQVNPFGLCWDKYENLYSADCHSNPLTQLIKGAYYPSFGKPNDGLGYGPVMCTHSHGSTGLCGVLYIDGGVWGPEWDDHMILGNCVTSKVNHDHITFEGSTPTANEGPDFISSDDSWFRPVDLQLGPDSALYVADFYNRIIGHYEIPLDHPGRDRTSGRIWRVSKTGIPSKRVDLAQVDNHQLVKQLDSPNLTLRRLAVSELTTRLMAMPIQDARVVSPIFKMEAGSPVKAPEKDEARLLLAECTTPVQRAYASWATLGVWKRTGKAIEFLGDNTNDFVDVHLLRREAEGPTPTWKMAIVYTASCLRPDQKAPVPRTQLAAARALVNCRPQDRGFAASMLIAEAMRAPVGDLTLKHTLLRSAQALLSDPQVFEDLSKNLSLPDASLTAPQADEFHKVTAQLRALAATLHHPAAAQWLAEELARSKGSPPDLIPCLGLIARSGEPEVIEQAVVAARRFAGSSRAAEIDAITALNNGLMERGVKPPAPLLSWATKTAQSLLDNESKVANDWTSLPHPDFPSGESPWCLQERKCSDGQEAQVLSSLDKGLKAPEKLTGILQSKSFPAPAKLSFWICGHEGQPKAEANHKNFVRLSDEQGKELRKTFPPHNDVCQRIEWDLSDLQGKPVRIEIVDGDNGPSYAWLGIARIEPAVASVEHFSAGNLREKQLRALALVLKMHVSADMRDRLRPFLPPSSAPPVVISAADRQRIDALIADRLKAFAKAKPNADKGAQVFITNCAVCHQIKGQGGLIGPQLDGIGNRGADRLMEDILDPNRNVDANFQMHVVTLLDGSTTNGFVRGEVGKVLILVDAAGQEHRVSKNEVKEDKATALSLMPPVFGQTIQESDFLDLIGYLIKRS